ncbi:MAG: PhoH family protein [Firmicutes bacterium]|nr:PhoH family protein [Bacillota bacterium]
MAVDKRKFTIPDNYQALQIMGHQEEHLRAMEEAMQVQILARGNELHVDGPAEQVARTVELLHTLTDLASQGQPLAAQDIRYAIRLAREGKLDQLADVYRDVILVTARGKPIKAKTLGQKRYVEAIRENPIVFGIGPAGTGKTYLAMALAVDAFRNRQVNRIVLTRPAVEAGEKLGFLPGDLQEKVDPYLRPLYDALYDILGVETFEKYMSRGMIEVAPLAYMRGRTLDDSFVILDEAQNTTPEQMKMFLTRLGFGSRAVVTGDITQVDLPREQDSGLAEVQRVLKGIRGIEFVQLTEQDIVRHPLVQAIIRAYDAYEQQRALESLKE